MDWPASEIVDFNAEAVTVKLLHDIQHFAVADHRALRDLQRNHPRGQPIAFQNTLIIQRHTLTAERRAGQVDGYGADLNPCFFHSLSCSQTDVNMYSSNRLFRRSFQTADEPRGREQRPVLLTPARKPLCRNDCAGLRIALGLIEHLKLVLGNRGTNRSSILADSKEGILNDILIKGDARFPLISGNAQSPDWKAHRHAGCPRPRAWHIRRSAARYAVRPVCRTVGEYPAQSGARRS